MSASGVVRPLRSADLAAVKSVIDRCGLFPSALLDDIAAEFLAGAGTPDKWLVHDDGAVTAVAYCAPERMTEGTWNLLLIAVDPARQGSGVGTSIMRHVEQELAASGWHLLLVETSGLPEFARTRQFYRGLGYEEEARIRDFYREGEDKIVFRKAIRRPG